MNKKVGRRQLEKLVDKYNTIDFIELDPICIPHRFSNKQDVEIAGLIAAIFAWGQRKTIINKANDFIQRMDNAPFSFVKNFEPKDLIRFQGFKHRTFNGDDALSILYFLQVAYREADSLEDFFRNQGEDSIKKGLIKMNQYFCALESTMKRSHKHVATPLRNSACKRLNMFLRWMVRRDESGVDFGIWKSIPMSELIIPLDLHVLRSAHAMGLLDEGKSDWKTAEHLTNALRKFDAEDPVKYDYALFNWSLHQSA